MILVLLCTPFVFCLCWSNVFKNLLVCDLWCLNIACCWLCLNIIFCNLCFVCFYCCSTVRRWQLDADLDQRHLHFIAATPRSPRNHQTRTQTWEITMRTRLPDTGHRKLDANTRQRTEDTGQRTQDTRHRVQGTGHRRRPPILLPDLVKKSAQIRGGSNSDTIWRISK